MIAHLKSYRQIWSHDNLLVTKYQSSLHYGILQNQRITRHSAIRLCYSATVTLKAFTTFISSQNNVKLSYALHHTQWRRLGNNIWTWLLLCMTSRHLETPSLAPLSSAPQVWQNSYFIVYIYSYQILIIIRSWLNGLLLSFKQFFGKKNYVHIYHMSYHRILRQSGSHNLKCPITILKSTLLKLLRFDIGLQSTNQNNG